MTMTGNEEYPNRLDDSTNILKTKKCNKIRMWPKVSIEPCMTLYENWTKYAWNSADTTANYINSKRGSCTYPQSTTMFGIHTQLCIFYCFQTYFDDHWWLFSYPELNTRASKSFTTNQTVSKATFAPCFMSKYAVHCMDPYDLDAFLDIIILQFVVFEMRRYTTR